jgi:hypothetical protein
VLLSLPTIQTAALNLQFLKMGCGASCVHSPVQRGCAEGECTLEAHHMHRSGLLAVDEHFLQKVSAFALTKLLNCTSVSRRSSNGALEPPARRGSTDAGRSAANAEAGSAAGTPAAPAAAATAAAAAAADTGDDGEPDAHITLVSTVIVLHKHVGTTAVPLILLRLR